MAVGINEDLGSGSKTIPFQWNENYVFKKAYVITYRYGRPAPHTMTLNGMDLDWGPQNQAGPELPEENTLSTWFAAHVKALDSIPNIESGLLTLGFPPQQFYDFAWNWGWWSMYVIILYESSDIDSSVCNRIYIADQRQDVPQHYTFDKPIFESDSPVLFSIFASRLSEFFIDRSRLTLNDVLIGEIWGPELFDKPGTQGHFYYEDSTPHGMNNDTANSTLFQYDGLAVVNWYFSEQEEQNLQIARAVSPMPESDNLHPAFTLTYTPTCALPTGDMPRRYTLCPQQTDPHGGSDTVEPLTLAAIPGYDHYAWTPGDAMDDSTLANPTLLPDTSRWYRVRMWDGDGDKCPQTIPVFVEVGKVPRPAALEVSPSACHQNTGRIAAQDVPGKAPLTYALNGQTSPEGVFDQLAPGSYDLSITTALGCSWDSTLVIDLKPIQTAAFVPDPETGYSPLEVFFDNQSTNATGYGWFIDGDYVHDNENLRYRFDAPGTYEVMLLAHYGDASCADTARYTLVVLPGLELALPNIITPNGDGMNDALTARLAGVAHIRWEVYNRWGNLLHRGEANAPGASLELWRPEEGQYPQGVYSVAVSAVGDSGQRVGKVVQVTVK